MESAPCIKEVTILGADKRERALWERKYAKPCKYQDGIEIAGVCPVNIKYVSDYIRRAR